MAVLATLVDFLHALVIVVWVGGLPLLFWHRWPRLTRAYAVYAILFVVGNLLSDRFLGECFITAITQYLWTHAAYHPAHVSDWFTVRFADLVFGMSPSHESIRLASKILIVVSAVGVLFAELRHPKRPPRAHGFG